MAGWLRLIPRCPCNESSWCWRCSSGSASVVALCRRFNVSRQTAYKFRRRFLQEGRAALAARRRGPKERKSALTQRWRKVVLLRPPPPPTWGARKLRWWLRQDWPRIRLPSERTIQRWLHGAGLAQRKARPYCARPAAVRTAARARCPNDVWTIDWKGWFCTGDGERCEPLTVRDLVSRYVLAIAVVGHRHHRGVGALCRRLFTQYGLPRAIRVDLGTPFCSTGALGLTPLSLWWRRLGIHVQFVRRAHGVDNNAHEQMHRVLKRETASPPARTLSSQRARLRRWRTLYNAHRPHDGLGERVPAACYRHSARRMPALAARHYPAGWLVRQVQSRGTISLAGRTHQIGRAFTGLTLGLQPHRGAFRVYCDHLYLGRLDPRTTTARAFTPAQP